MILMVTGHRPKRLNNEWNLDGPCCAYVRSQMVEHIESIKPSEAISGMALGSDTIFAEAILDMGIPLTAAIPFEHQDNRWPFKSKLRYRRLLEKAAKVIDVSQEDLSEIVCTDTHDDGSVFEDTGLEFIGDEFSMYNHMHNRNAWMVHHCDESLAVVEDSSMRYFSPTYVSGGTGGAVARLLAKEKIIHYIDPNLWRENPPNCADLS